MSPHSPGAAPFPRLFWIRVCDGIVYATTMYDVFFAFCPFVGAQPCIFVDFSLFNDEYVASGIYKNVVFIILTTKTS